MGNELRIAIKMADTAEALLARVTEARSGLFEVPSAPPGGFGIDPMLLALAMELALKAWITADQDAKPIRVHNLSKLFNMLKPEQREKIENDLRISCPWYRPCPLDPMGVDAARILDAHADAFVEWRYMHEMTRGSFSHSDMESVLASVLKLFRARQATKTITPLF